MASTKVVGGTSTYPLKGDTHMLCSALTTKGNACKNDHVSGLGHTGPDGWVYYHCSTHDKRYKSGLDMEFIQEPIRGHAALQPGLDLNNPVHTAWATKERTKTIINNIEDPPKAFRGALETDRCMHGNPPSCSTCHQLFLEERKLQDQANITTEQIAAMPDVTEFIFPEFKVMCTGHRANAFTEIELTHLESLLDRFFTSLKGMHPDETISIIAGGADGADRAFARGAVRNELEFDLFLPHEGYGANYFGTSRWFTNMCNAARSIRYSSTVAKFHYSMNFVRNIDMIKAADLHVVITSRSISQLLTARRGGTSHAVKEMKKAGIEQIVKINPARNTITWVNLQNQ